MSATGVPQQLLAGAYVHGAVTLSDAATIATNAALGDVFKVTITTSRTMGAPTNPVAGQKAMWCIKQGGSGSNGITWNAVFNWGAGGTPTPSTALGAVDVFGGVYDAGEGEWLMVPPALGY